MLEVFVPYAILGLGLFITLMRTIKVLNDDTKRKVAARRSTYIHRF